MRQTQELLACIPQQGRVVWIGVRPVSHGGMIELEAVEARREAGLTGDHARAGPKNPRQVTVIQWEHLQVISSLLNKTISAADMRRNMAVSGINLFSLRNRQFSIGSAVFETTGWCQPCARLEERLGAGTFQASRGHGGITARVLQGGIIRLGDPVKVVPL